MWGAVQSSADEKPLLLTRVSNQKLWQWTVFPASSLLLFKGQPALKGHATLGLSGLVICQSHHCRLTGEDLSRRGPSTALNINKDIAQVNLRLGMVKDLEVLIHIADGFKWWLWLGDHREAFGEKQQHRYYINNVPHVCTSSEAHRAKTNDKRDNWEFWLVCLQKWAWYIEKFGQRIFMIYSFWLNDSKGTKSAGFHEICIFAFVCLLSRRIVLFFSLITGKK